MFAIAAEMALKVMPGHL